MSKSKIYAVNDDLAADVAGKQNRLASIQAELDSLRDGIAAMPTTYGEHQTEVEALAVDHPERIKWDELKAEFLALQATVNSGVTPTPIVPE